LAEASTIRVVITALIGNAALAAAKYVVAAFSGSGAMFAEAVHSTVDTGNEALLLLGIQRTERPEDGRHTFGHGKEIYFWSFVVAILLFGLGAGVSISKGFDKLGEPQPLAHVGWIYLVLALGLLFQLATWLLAWREVRETRAGRPLLTAIRRANDPALFPLIFADTAAVIGLVAALVGVFCTDQLGWLWADGAATLLIGAIMALAAILLVAETRGLLIGEAAEPHLVEDIIGVAGRAAFVHAVNEVRTMQVGRADWLVNLSVDARDHLSAG
jgi:cation diffusion facilitator family transporter